LGIGVISNYELFFNPSRRTDLNYIVTNPPLTGEDGIIIKVDLKGQQSALLDGYSDEPTISVSDIRSGKIKDAWLLSGGTLIMDCGEPRKIAIGVRDANTADPFTYTNIGAGRCDQKLFDHCMDEFETEFILGLKVGNTWHQVMWGPQTPPFDLLKKPDIQMKIWKILKTKGKVKSESQTIQMKPHILLYDHHELFQKVTILWDDFEEIIHGYVWLDFTHHTTEFRLPVCIDLCSYQDSMIFFGEGTGYALWKTIDQVRALAAMEKNWGTALLTPFLKRFIAESDQTG
jgi:hypothetical protein